jgi:hypothetical protein
MFAPQRTATGFFTSGALRLKKTIATLNLLIEQVTVSIKAKLSLCPQQEASI